MITSALYIGTGIALSGAVHQAVTAAVQPVARVSVHLMFAVLCLCIAGFSLAAAMTHTAVGGGLYAASNAVIATGLLCWAALLGFVTLSVQPQRLWIPLALGACWGGLFLLNIGVTGNLLYLDFVATRSTQFPYSGSARSLPVGQAWLLVNALALATWSYALWAARELQRRGQESTAVSWTLGLIILAIVTLMDFATAAGWLPAFYVSAFGWIALLVLFCGPLLARPSSNRLTTEVPHEHPRDTVSAGAIVPSLPHLPRHDSGITMPMRRPRVQPDMAVVATAHAEAVSPRVPDQQRSAHATDAAMSSGAPVSAPPTDTSPTSNATEAVAQDLSSIIEFTHIALRRIERGKQDPKKFAALFRAILNKAETVRHTLEQPVDEDCDINEVVAQGIAQVLPLFDEAGIKIGFRQARHLPTVCIGRSVVLEVLRDLLAEAFAATTSSAGCLKPVVVMTRQTRNGSVEVSVTDGGNEMSLDEIQGAFESLLEGKQTARGARLIATAERIAAHGGQLRCTPNPAGGSIRHLRLPTR